MNTPRIRSSHTISLIPPLPSRATPPGRRGAVLFLAIGTLAVLFMLALATLFAAQNGRTTVRLQHDRDDQTAIRATLESLARSSPEGLAAEGALQLGRWQIAWQTVPLKDSGYADVEVPDKGALEVIHVAGRRGGPDAPPGFLQETLLVRRDKGPWTIAAWRTLRPNATESASAAPAQPSQD